MICAPAPKYPMTSVSTKNCGYASHVLRSRKDVTIWFLLNKDITKR